MKIHYSIYDMSDRSLWKISFIFEPFFFVLKYIAAFKMRKINKELIVI